MKAGKCIQYLTIIFALSVISVSSQAYADEEVLGRKAEQAGKLRQALTHYVSALQSASYGSSTEQRLREKIIRLAPKIHPPPAVPEQAERHMARGRRAVKSANDEQGFMRAAKEFRYGLNIAPWLVDGYYNLGVVLDKAGKYDEAIENLKLYLVAVPDAKDAKNLIYEIEYQKEEASRQRVKAREKANTRLLASLSGEWKVKKWDINIGNTSNDKPTRYSTWKDLSLYYKGRLVMSYETHVSIKGNSIEIIIDYYSEGKLERDGWRIFQGTLKGNTISGFVVINAQPLYGVSCPPAGTKYSFEGTTWFDEDKIMLIVPHSDWYGGEYGCMHRSYNYAQSYLLVR